LEESLSWKTSATAAGRERAGCAWEKEEAVTYREEEEAAKALGSDRWKKTRGR
jgi:hypothetical protein